jgi:uncharacterized repeat protein (TIGR03803 family)
VIPVGQSNQARQSFLAYSLRDATATSTALLRLAEHVVITMGAVYQMTSSGNVTVLHSFGFVGTEGAAADSGLTLASDGNLYGTTKAGGTHNLGTIFMISVPDGTLTYLHQVIGTDGAYPTAPPIQGSDGYFYGTTWQAGTNNGTAYRMAPKSPWTLTSYSLPGFAYPTAPLMQATDGNFYGATSGGGTHGFGTVFRMTSKGKFKFIYNFNNVDGASPKAPVIQGSDGNFYGTTSAGGNLSACKDLRVQGASGGAFAWRAPKFPRLCQIHHLPYIWNNQNLFRQ